MSLALLAQQHAAEAVETLVSIMRGEVRVVEIPGEPDEDGEVTVKKEVYVPSDNARVAAAVEIFNRGYGRPQRATVEDGGGPGL